jgi:hypothetical protein
MYMLMIRDQSAGQNHTTETFNRSFKNLEQFKYLGTIVTNPNFIQEKIKRRLNSDNAYYHSVQNHLSSRLLPMNIEIRTKKNVFCL